MKSGARIRTNIVDITMRQFRRLFAQKALAFASNSKMFKRLEEAMDINCGLILDGEVSVQEMGQRIFEELLKHASGQPTKSELLGLGDHEFVPWHLGVVS